jgi:signal transduction histidine kinase
LLTLARIDPGQSKKDFAEVSLNSVSMEVLSRLTPQALSLQVDVELQADDEISVPGNSELMGLMLGNLLENSIRAASPGGRVTVRVGWGSEGPSLVVEDTGPGIPEQDMNRVFDRFYRRPGTPGPGAGIGLSIVRSIVELHDATMVLAIRQGHPGLSVTVIFPGETGAR